MTLFNLNIGMCVINGNGNFSFCFLFFVLHYLWFRKVAPTQGLYESNIKINFKQAHPITNLMSLIVENVFTPFCILHHLSLSRANIYIYIYMNTILQLPFIVKIGTSRTLQLLVSNLETNISLIYKFKVSMFISIFSCTIIYQI